MSTQYRCECCGAECAAEERVWVETDPTPVCPNCGAHDMLFPANEEQQEPECLVVTRHQALVEYLRELNLVPAGVRVISHAAADDVRNAHVYGVLPLHLAAEAERVTEVTLNLPAELRGQELNLEQVRQFAGEPVT